MASRTIAIRLTAEGADALKAQLLAIGDTGSEAMAALTRATARGAAGFETLQRSLDPAYAALQRLYAQQTRINAALAAGNTTQERAAQLLGLAQARYDAATQSLGRHGQAAALATQGTGRFNQAIGQAGFQLQDFVVQVGGGQSALLALAQQGSQFAGVFGPGGAVAGAGLAIGAIVLSLIAGQSAAEKLTVEMERQGATYRDATGQAEHYLSALRAQGAQYLSAEVAGQRYREGLRGEGENLVALTRYYQGLTAAQREYEQDRLTGDNQRRLLLGDTAAREIRSILRSPLNPANPAAAGEAAAFAPQTPDYARATEAIAAFRRENSYTETAVLSLRRQLAAARDSNGDYASSIAVMIQALDGLLPRLREMDEAQRRANIRQLALSGTGSPEQLRAGADMAAGEVGGLYQQRQRLLEQQRLLRGGMGADPTPEQAAGYRSSQQAIAAQLEGLAPATQQYIRGLREQAEAMRYTEGAARAYAEADLALDRAARAAGQGMASAAEKAAARQAIQARLNEEVGHALDAVDRQVQGEQLLTDALARGGEGFRHAEAQVRALAEARRYAHPLEERSGVIIDALTQKYQEAAASAQRLADARAGHGQRQELEAIAAETRLLGANADVRERELAILRERQRILATPGADITTPEAQARLANAAALAEARQELERTRSLYAELEGLGTRAFERIGSAITQAFATGSLRAIRFRDIAKAALSEVLQTGLKLAVVNPILNGVLGGTRASLFAATPTAAATNAIGTPSGSGSLGGGGFGMPNPSSLRGFTDGSFNSGWASLDSTVNTPLYATLGEQYGPLSAANPTGFVGNGGTVTIGGAAAGVLGLAGGAYGIYTGLQTGGARGAAQTIGGTAGLISGASTLLGGAGAVGASTGAVAGVLGAGAAGALGAVAAFAPYLAIAAAVAAMFLPGQKPSNAAAGAMLGLDGGALRLLDSGKSTGATRDGRDRLASAFSAQIDALLPLTGGIRPAGTVGFNIGQRDPSDVQYYNPAGQLVSRNTAAVGDAEGLQRLVGDALLQGYREQAALSPDLQSVFRNSGDFNAAIANLQWYQASYKPFIDSRAKDPADVQRANALQALQDQIAGLTKPFEEAAAKAASLGLATTELAQAQEAAYLDFQRQREAQQKLVGLSLEARLLQATGREVEAALLEQRVRAEQERDAFRTQLLQLAPEESNTAWRGEMLAKLDAVQAAEKQQLLAQQLLAQQSEAERAAQAALQSQARGFFEQLVFGNAGGLTPEAQYRAGLQTLAGAGSELLAGGSEALGTYTRIAQSFLPIARTYLGTSESYASLVADIAGTVRSAGGDPQNIAALFEAQAGGLDRIGSALAALGSTGEQQTGIARDTLSELRRLASAIEALLARRVLS